MNDQTFICKDCKQSFAEFQGEDTSLPLKNGSFVHITHLRCPKCNEPQFTITNPREITSMNKNSMWDRLGTVENKLDKMKSDSEAAE